MNKILADITEMDFGCTRTYSDINYRANPYEFSAIEARSFPSLIPITGQLPLSVLVSWRGHGLRSRIEGNNEETGGDTFFPLGRLQIFQHLHHKLRIENVYFG